MSTHLTFDSAPAYFVSQAVLAQARSNLFALVAFAFLDPTPDSASRLVDGSFLAQLRTNSSELEQMWPAAPDALALLVEAQDIFSAADPDELLHTLKVEYARLFIGPYKPVTPPYATLYGPRSKDSAPMLMVSAEANAVAAAYREAGVALATKLHEPPDHFAIEAEFLYYLHQQESDCWAAGKESEANAWQRRHEAFMQRHFTRWGSEFCRQVESESLHPFYRAAAHLAGALILLQRGEAG